jgi:type IV pilus assembly protein PilE
MKTLHKKQFPGFTLIELMIVLVIVAILLAIAYPSYVNYMRKAKRGEAQQLLLNWSINQEIFRSNNPTYTNIDPDHYDILPKPVHIDGHYTFEDYQTKPVDATTCTGELAEPNATAYLLYATAQNDQVNDVGRDGVSCAVICLSSNGAKHPASCWE